VQPFHRGFGIAKVKACCVKERCNLSSLEPKGGPLWIVFLVVAHSLGRGNHVVECASQLGYPQQRGSAFPR
jgi:hypothetical protein